MNKFEDLRQLASHAFAAVEAFLDALEVRAACDEDVPPEVVAWIRKELDKVSVHRRWLEKPGVKTA